MNCKGNFIFKTLTHRPGGTFKNSEGADVKYPSAYILKVDELLETGEINERKFKIAEDKTLLINTLNKCKAYDEICLKFKITLFDTRVALEIVDGHLVNDDVDIDEDDF